MNLSIIASMAFVIMTSNIYCAERETLHHLRQGSSRFGGGQDLDILNTAPSILLDEASPKENDCLTDLLNCCLSCWCKPTSNDDDIIYTKPYTQMRDEN